MKAGIIAYSPSSASVKTRREGHWSGFHQGWCNSLVFVNRTLQKLKIVLVSDPFTKDSGHSAVPDFFNKVDAKFGLPCPAISRQIRKLT
jgi:hypothetical protein